MWAYIKARMNESSSHVALAAICATGAAYFGDKIDASTALIGVASSLVAYLLPIKQS